MKKIIVLTLSSFILFMGLSATEDLIDLKNQQNRQQKVIDANKQESDRIEENIQEQKQEKDRIDTQIQNNQILNQQIEQNQIQRKIDDQRWWDKHHGH